MRWRSIAWMLVPTAGYLRFEAAILRLQGVGVGVGVGGGGGEGDKRGAREGREVSCVTLLGGLRLDRR